jgi:phthalate 4,5-dioxygenase oxygenase subunit
MGARETLPPLPDIEPNMLPEGEYTIQKTLRECNWVQGLEGDIDTAHLGYLHMGAIDPAGQEPQSFNFYTVNDRAPRYSVVETEFGTSYGTYRPAEADTYYWRIAHFLFPCYTMIPTGTLGLQVLVRAWVPLDDTHMMHWNISARRYTFGQNGGSARTSQASNGAAGAAVPLAFRNGGYGDYVPDTTDWLGRFRLASNRGNDYNIDRELQRNDRSTNGYTGISGISLQDQAITESMGAIVGRPNEHLGSTDSMVIRTRRRLINAARDLEAKGTIPPGVDNPEVYRYRSGGVILPRNVDWREGTRELQKAFVDRTPETLAAAVPGA